MADDARSKPTTGKNWFSGLRQVVDRARPSNIAKLATLAEALLGVRGEVSGTALAAEILSGCERLGAAERLEFLKLLVDRFGADRARLDRAVERYRADPSAENGTALHVAAEPRRQELIRRLNLAPGGTAQVVRIREDLLRLLPEHPELAPLDADCVHLLSSWFNRGFLTLRRVDWNTPALILEKIIRYEAVHAISSWDDLRRRIDPADRLCYAFFHPTLPDDPLIFVEVALTREIPAAISPLLAVDRRPLDARRATVAVFYSISNCQTGLRGVPLGNLLIKQVVQELKQTAPGLKTFVTLSPVPGFAGWLAQERTAKASSVLPAADRDVLRALDTPGWHERPDSARALKPVLSAAIAAYFLQARAPNGRVIDAVARFHLNNGARLERVNWLADTSARSLEQGLGFMVNYLYDLGEIEKNHEAFANHSEVVASREVHRLLRPRA